MKKLATLSLFMAFAFTGVVFAEDCNDGSSDVSDSNDVSRTSSDNNDNNRIPESEK
jgi:hypothetical protein